MIFGHGSEVALTLAIAVFNGMVLLVNTWMTHRLRCHQKRQMEGDTTPEFNEP